MPRKFGPLFIITTGILILSVSCFKSRTGFPVYYNVINNTDREITIVFKLITYFPNRIIFPEVMDSIININSQQRQSLFVKLYDDLDETSIYNADTFYFLDTLMVYINDTIPANKNFKQKKYWDYIQLNNSKAEYNLKIDNNTFLP